MALGADVTFDFFGKAGLGPKGIWYHADFKVPETRPEYTVSLMRSHNDNAPGSRVGLPAPFEITEPSAGSSIVFSRSRAPIAVRWSPSDTANTMSLAAIIACEDGRSETWFESSLADIGIFTITANTFSSLKGECTASLNVQRSQSGLLDPAFGKGGIISGRQSRNVNLNTVE